MNNNGARNYALEIGKKNRSKWTLVFDGNIFIPKNHWPKIIDDMDKFKVHYLIFPMARINDYSQVEDYKHLDYCEEPQIGFNINSNENFNEDFVYGSRPKIELLQRILTQGSINSARSNIPNFYMITMSKKSFYKLYLHSGNS